MHYTQKLQHTLLAAKVQAAIPKMHKRQLAEAGKLAALANAEKNGAAAVLMALIKAVQEGQEGAAALQAAQAEVQAHQGNIDAMAAAIRARQIALAKAEAQAAAIARKGDNHEAD